jgi:glycosyltransferase involved in cell wall biosynthesis
MKKRVLIVQNEVMSYRQPVYDALGEYYDVTLLHSGKPAAEPGDRFREIITPKSQLWNFHFQHGVLKHLDPDQYDAAILMFDLWWPNNIRAVWKRRRPPLILWGHRHSLNPVANLIRYRVMKSADAHLLYGDEDVLEILLHRIPRETVFVAPNTQYVSNSQDTSGVPGKHRLIFVGRLQRIKRVHVLIDAFYEALPSVGKNIVLSIVGNGFEEERLKAQAQELGLKDRIQFHGEVRSDRELLPLFRESIAYFTPGAVGLGLLHAFAYGVTCVTTLRPRQRHGQEFMNLKHDVNSLVLESEAELAGTIVTLCKDRALARRLGAVAYRTYHETRRLDQMVEGFRNSIEYAIRRARLASAVESHAPRS